MASYALSFFVLCVIVAVIQASVIKTDRVEVPAEGMTLKIVIKPDAEGKLKVQVKTVDKGRRWRTTERRPRVESVPPEVTKDKGDKVPISLPSIENRFGIAVGKCPDGYVSRSDFCFPDYDV